MIGTVRRSIRKDDGVSAVIGTILMIAATVILGGVIYAATSGFGEKETTSGEDLLFKAQAYDVDGDQTSDTIRITYVSGPSGVSPRINITNLDGSKVTSVDASNTGLILCKQGEVASSEDITPIPALPVLTLSPGEFVLGETEDSDLDTACDAPEMAPKAYLVQVKVGDNVVVDTRVTV